jgi:hypothetical protein
MGWRLLTNQMPPCEACAMGKAKQKKVPKRSTRVKATQPGERLYHDISKIMGSTELGCPKSQWHISIWMNTANLQNLCSTKTEQLHRRFL